MKSLTLQIASHPDRDGVVSELWFGEDQVAEVSKETSGVLRIEMFPAPNGGSWIFDFDALHAVLVKAKEGLAGLEAV